jgi:hypothetical protein
MTEITHPQLVLLGLPRSGKSTFLGALWALVQSPMEPTVRETRFSGDRTYIQDLAEQLARGEQLDRTVLDIDDGLAVELGFDHGGIADVMIPDSSGESLELLIEQRRWHPRLLSACEGATAALLFLHPERLTLPEPITAGAHRTDAYAPAGREEEDGVDFHPGEPVAFRAVEHQCTAASLIDAFENLDEVWRDQPIRLGVVVSAWDLVAGEPHLTPYEWLQAWLPGLLATLEAGREPGEVEVFGVSAQGGPLEARDELLARGEVYDRVFAEDRHGRAVSLTEPVRWAIWGE